MRLALIGAGSVGATLGRRWFEGGHTVVFGVRNPEDPKYDSLRALGAGVTLVDAAVEGAEVVVLATPWPATREVVEDLGEALDGKIVVDATNPLRPDLAGLEVDGETSGGEQIAAWASPGAKVVKAFNTTGFANMADPVIDGRRTVMFVCGDDADARRTVVGLSKSLGFETIEAGGLAIASARSPGAPVDPLVVPIRPRARLGLRDRPAILTNP